MTRAIYANVPVAFLQPPPVSFSVTNSTVAKVLIEPQPAVAETSTTPQYYGGCTAIDLVATSSDASNKALMIYQCTVATTQDAGNTGAMTTTTSTIPRTTGSFITDGFLVGDQVMTFAPFGTAPNAGVDGIPCILTGVAALTLTLSGTPIAALALAAGTRVVRVNTHGRVPVLANSGTDGTVASTQLIGNALDNSLLTTELKLGPLNLLAVAMQAAVSALPALVSVASTIARY